MANKPANNKNPNSHTHRHTHTLKHGLNVSRAPKTDASPPGRKWNRQLQTAAIKNCYVCLSSFAVFGLWSFNNTYLRTAVTLAPNSFPLNK